MKALLYQVDPTQGRNGKFLSDKHLEKNEKSFVEEGSI